MIIPAGFAQVNLRFTGDGAPTGAEVTFGVANGTDLTPSQIIERVDTALGQAAVMEDIDSSVTISSILVKVGPNETGAFAEGGVSIPGENSGGALTPNTALLVRKATLAGGRASRGRNYWPGVPEGAAVDSGLLDAGYRTSQAATYDDLLLTLDANDVPMVLLHADVANSPDLVVAYTLQGRVATQRRRLRR